MGVAGKGFVIWLTGLPASGKSTIARDLGKLMEDSARVVMLDGDIVRGGVSRDLGFSREDRIQQAVRVACMAVGALEAGAVPIVALVSPYEEGRQKAADIIGNAGYDCFMVYVDTPLEVCEQRDPKGMYQKARAGELQGFTGVDDPYEAPRYPSLSGSHVYMAKSIMACLKHMGSWR